MGCICSSSTSKKPITPTQHIKPISDEIIREGHFIGRPESLSKYTTKKIFEQMDKSVCKIITSKSTGTGFFCIIPFPDKLNPLPVLITCNHVLGEENLNPGKEIKYEINGIEKIIKINNSRKIYTSDKDVYDITIIEIKPEDQFDINNMLEIEDDIFKDEILNNTYKNKTIYIIHYPNGKEPTHSVDVIKSIDMQNLSIHHLCSTEEGSSGGPLFNVKTHRVIGIHTGKHKNYKWNAGLILKIPIYEFNEKYKNNLGCLKNYKNAKKVNENNCDISFNIIEKKESLEPKDNLNLSDIKGKTNKKVSSDEINSIDIEIIDFYICNIYYKLNKKKIIDLGILIKIPYFNSKGQILGVLTKYYVEENILNNINTINIIENDNILRKINSNDRFNFSDPFLNVTFIEIKDLQYDFIEIYDGNKIPKELLLIEYSDIDNSCNYKEIEIKKGWGIYFFYNEVNVDEYNYESSSSKLALLYNNQIFGIHKEKDYQNNIGININVIAKAIKLNFKSKLQNIQQNGNPLSTTQIKELNKNGLELSNIPNLLISLPSSGVTPIWFYRTKYAWYWTPTKPDKNELNKINWMIIYPGNSLKVIGGKWDGIEPAERNIDLIHWLEKNGLKYI